MGSRGGKSNSHHSVLGSSLPTLTREPYPDIGLEDERENTHITCYVQIRQEKNIAEEVLSRIKRT